MVCYLYDNSSVETAKILSIKHVNRRYCELGDIVTIVPCRYTLNKKFLKKRGKLLGLVIALSKWINRASRGTWIKFKHNKLLLIDVNGKFLGTRVYGKICFEIGRDPKKANLFRKIILYSKGYL